MAKKKTLTKGERVKFTLNAAGAKDVKLVGDFNNWDDKKTPLLKDKKREWGVELLLKPGRYEYKFVVDGNWINDPDNSCMVWNAFGTENSVVEI